MLARSWLCAMKERVCFSDIDGTIMHQPESISGVGIFTRR